MSKVLLFANTDWYLFNFRLSLAESVRSLGHEVVMVSPHGKYVPKILDAGFRWLPVNLAGSGRCSRLRARAVLEIASVFRREQPILVHNFTIKCVLLGGSVARYLGIGRVNAITGLGHLFTDERIASRLLRAGVGPVLRYACGGGRVACVFQNEEDQEVYQACGFAREEGCHLIRGSGADIERLTPRSSLRADGPCRFLFASRLIREKGIDELVAACRVLRDRDCSFELCIAGDIYPDNPSSLTRREVEKLSDYATVLGHCDDIDELLRHADVVVLPSYREGTPRILLEAGACGLPLIATDIAGCRGIVQPERNGILVPVGDSESLAYAMQELAESPALRAQYGRQSRLIVEAGFSEQSVVHRTINVYRSLGFGAALE